MNKSSLPDGFVYLKNVDPSIVQNVMYAGPDNFMGRPVRGYETNTIILTSFAAEALKMVQKELQDHSYSLVVYDAYRPQQAVDSFIEWSQDPSDQINKPLYYPTINKADVFDLGYIAKRSGHSRGSTVDLSIMPLKSSIHKPVVSHRKLTNGEMIPYLDDGSEDMGSSVDLMHEASYHDTSLIDKVFVDRRNFFRNVMKKNGFKEYPKEWWHYTLEKEPFPDTYFNFPVL